MSFIRDLRGHQSDRRSFIKHPNVYGTEEPTYTYFDEDGTNPHKNIVVEGRLCVEGSEIMGRKVDGCPFVYMPIDYWPNLTRDLKLSKAKGYFDRMIEDKDKGSIPKDASFVARVALMNARSSWCEEYSNHRPNYISYRDYLKMNNEKFVEFLDKLLGSSSTEVGKKVTNKNQPNEKPYYPTKEDFKNALRDYSRRHNIDKEGMPVDNILDIMEKSLSESGYTLADDWCSVTENNIQMWSKEEKGKR